MMITRCLALMLALLLGAALPGPAAADESKPIALPAPQLEGGKTLMQALKDRATLREFASDELSAQTLSNLLWAAAGINRPDSGRRTAPSAHNRQEIEVYVITAKGTYLYDPKPHSLSLVSAEDIRALAGTQNFVKDAPLNLVYVADWSKMGQMDETQKVFISAADTGFISENVYLYCASAGLATVVRASIDREKLAQAMKLKPDQRITLSQTVGNPKARH